MQLYGTVLVIVFININCLLQEKIVSIRCEYLTYNNETINYLFEFFNLYWHGYYEMVIKYLL